VSFVILGDEKDLERAVLTILSRNPVSTDNLDLTGALACSWHDVQY